jgi:cytochrome c peroxidase
MRPVTRDRRLLCLVVLVGPVLLAFRSAGRFEPASIRAAGAIPSRTVPFSLPQGEDELLKQARDHFKALPKDMATAEFPAAPDRVKLGRMLFFDPRISVDGTVSCARCHLSSLYATDALPKSRGAHDKLLSRNAPTVLNAAIQFTQHWRGDFETVEEQAKRSLLGPSFANPDYATAMARVQAISGYADMFKKVFPDDANPVTADNWGKAIGAYERTLVTPSRFDDYLGGKADALSADEQRGLRTFIDTGCANCHSGAAVGGGKFRTFGVREDYWKATRSTEIDRGRVEITEDAADLYAFKVPGLRNVEMTPPYFHDGSVAALSDAVRVMARVQLGKKLSDDDTAAIVTFLKSLTGRLPHAFANAPVLPTAGFVSTPPVKDKVK